MKFVSAAKLKRAQDRVLASRPYARRMLAVLNSLVTRAQAGRDEEAVHPLLSQREEKRVELVVITADKGLCGAFNSNLIKVASQFLARQAQREVRLSLVGKKGWDYFKRRSFTVRRQYVNFLTKVEFGQAQQVAHALREDFVTGEADAVYLAYNEFKTVMRQEAVVEQLLPIVPLKQIPEGVAMDYLYEQPQRQIFERLVPRHVEVQVYHALLESAAAEHGARMTAMESATKNAEEMMESLTLKMNKIRQAGITKELIEIVSGANALAR